MSLPSWWVPRLMEPWTPMCARGIPAVSEMRVVRASAFSSRESEGPIFLRSMSCREGLWTAEMSLRGMVIIHLSSCSERVA